MTLEEAERYDNYWKQGAGSFKSKKMPDGNVQEIVISSGDAINARQRLQTNLNGVM